MTKNAKLNRANRKRYDEYYTLYEDIEKECNNYKHHFQDKVIYCNCDDPVHSNFYKYFYNNFHSFGLKKLICSYYINQQLDLFTTEIPPKPEYWIYDGKEVVIRKFKRDGDFRGQESIALLKQADIVATNPPFSLFIAHFKQLMKYQKQFITIGALTALHYVDIYPYFRDGIVTGGVKRSNTMDFIVKNGYEGEVKMRGNLKISVKPAMWYTNMKALYKRKKFVLTKEYNQADYPVYDNFNAIDVTSTNDIPKDYSGLMGLPITFLAVYNPDQFEVVGLCREMPKNRSYRRRVRGFTLNNKELFTRVVIRNKELNVK